MKGYKFYDEVSFINYSCVNDKSMDNENSNFLISNKSIFLYYSCSQDFKTHSSSYNFKFQRYLIYCISSSYNLASCYHLLNHIPNWPMS